ncbi:MAG: tRNA uridine-5-carboxymethylaminomethyl(34) synthesis enzyme MnmG, partial [Candidatus Eisenbacteria bacterium]
GLVSKPLDIGRHVEIRIRYAGYIARQQKSIEQYRKLESLVIPDSLFDEELSAISREGREKLLKVRPRSVGQASRLEGVSPADVSALLIYLKRRSDKRNHGPLS